MYREPTTERMRCFARGHWASSLNPFHRAMGQGELFWNAGGQEGGAGPFRPPGVWRAEWKRGAEMGLRALRGLGKLKGKPPIWVMLPHVHMMHVGHGGKTHIYDYELMWKISV